MDPKFKLVVESLQGSFERLTAFVPINAGHEWSKDDTAGVYLFTENGVPLYVGRTNNLKRRYSLQTRTSSRHNQAVFAFRLAREATGYTKVAYKKGEGSRAWLGQHPPFLEAFNAAKRRVAAMDYRYVIEPDPVRQCILEVYCAVALNTRYNDFDNH